MLFDSTLGSTYSDYALTSGSGYNLVGGHIVSCNLNFIRLNIKAMSMRSSPLLPNLVTSKMRTAAYMRTIFIIYRLTV